jgi:hypothetical protein
MSLSGGELALSLAAAAGLYYMYYEGKKLLGGKTPSDDPGYGETQEGINPNWKPGGKIEPSNGSPFKGSPVPNCQVWNENFQVFEDTGDAEANASLNACFTKYSSYLARYVDKDLQPHFSNPNPLVDPNKQDHGICFLYQNGNWLSYNGPAPLNMDERLCFAASQQLQGQGLVFWNSQGDNSFRMNPNISYGNAPFSWYTVVDGINSNGDPTTSPIPAAGWANGESYSAPPSGGHCEKQVNYALYEFWAHTPDVAQNDGNVSSCVNSTNSQNRYNDGKNFIYWDDLYSGLITVPIDK